MLTDHSSTDCYRIRIEAQLDEQWSDWLEGLNLDHCVDGSTVLTGLLPDQTALMGVLLKLHHLGLRLISVNKCEQVEEKCP